MLLVPVRIAPSFIHGLGVYAAGPIRVGTPVWRWVPPFDRSFSPDEFDRLPLPARQHVEHFGYLGTTSRLWHLGGDLAIFMNHANTPNTGAPDSTGPAPETIALRDIAPGEELTCDYRTFDASEKPVLSPRPETLHP